MDMNDMEKVRDELIKYEFKRRIEARKVIRDSFEMDNIHFVSSSLCDDMFIIGDIDKLAKLMGAEIYSFERNDKQYRGFEYEGIEVYSYV